MKQSAAVFDHDTVLGAVPVEVAIAAVRDAFVRHYRGDWRMPPKVYLDCPPHGDFRAMPASGDGVAIVKWVTSFPSNRARGLPTVTGQILASDAVDGRWLALIDGRAVTALRTGAAAAVAAAALARADAATAGVVGCGLHGRWAARCLVAAGFRRGVCADRDGRAAAALADELGWRAGSLRDALACDVITLVTPGSEPVLDEAGLRPGTHVNALGADGPGKAEMTPGAVARCRVFCDEWEQASHGGEITGAVTSGLLGRAKVTELGAVLAGDAPGRTSADEVTLFDSTGLAIQDLAIVRVLLEAERDGRVTPGRVIL